MSESFWHVVRDERYRKQTGETDRRKREEEANRRAADRRQRETMGEDHPKWP